MKKTILLYILGGLAVLVLIVYFLFRATAGLPETAEKFFAAARENNYDLAYSLVARDFKSNTSRDELITFLKDNKLDNCRDFSWPSREIQNDQGTLTGTLVNGDGGKTPVVITFIKENKDWKILSIRKDYAGVENGAASSSIPNHSQLEEMATASVVSLGNAINSQDFSSFYNNISRLWQSQTTKGQLREIFREFKTKNIDITNVSGIKPVFNEKPYIDKDKLLNLKGNFPTKPNITYFELSYMYEHPQWKLFGINVIVR